MIQDTPVRGAQNLPTSTHPGDPSNGSAARYAEEGLSVDELEAEGRETEKGKLPPHAETQREEHKPMDPTKTGDTQSGSSTSGDYPPPEDS